MSHLSTPEFDLTMEAFLEAGPDQLSSRLATSIVEAIHTTPRRRITWWNRPPARVVVPAAALFTLAAAIGLAFALTLGRSSPQPTSTPQPPTDSTRPAVGTLRAGEPYHLSAFSAPLHFTTPSDASVTVVADSAKQHGQRLLLADGAITFHDGADTVTDLCHPDRGLLGTFGATPQAVGEWLRSTPGLTVSKTTRLPVEGRVALAWNIKLGPGCYARHVAPSAGAWVWFQRGERHRIYAVPTGRGVIALFTWGSGYRGEGEEVLPTVNRLADQIVESITFE